MTIRSLLLASLILLVPATALAEHPHRADKAERKARLVERFDANGDGRLDKAEKKQAKQAKRAKKMAKKSAKRAKKFDKMIERLDRNGDGMLGPDEVGDRFARLRRFDHNGDGWVDRAEIHRGPIKATKK